MDRNDDRSADARHPRLAETVRSATREGQEFPPALSRLATPLRWSCDAERRPYVNPVVRSQSRIILSARPGGYPRACWKHLTTTQGDLMFHDPSLSEPGIPPECRCRVGDDTREQSAAFRGAAKFLRRRARFSQPLRSREDPRLLLRGVWDGGADSVGAHGIPVTAISTGAVKTCAPFTMEHSESLLNEATPRATLRRSVDAREVGHAALLLASNYAHPITGEALYVESGFYIEDMVFHGRTI